MQTDKRSQKHNIERRPVEKGRKETSKALKERKMNNPEVSLLVTQMLAHQRDLSLLTKAGFGLSQVRAVAVWRVLGS